MRILYNVERLREIVDDICALTGVAMAIADTNHTFLYANTQKSYEFCALLQQNAACREQCRQCDKWMMQRAEALRRPVSHICHAGLFDTGMPIIKGDITVGYVVFGRVRDKDAPDEDVLGTLAAYGFDRDELFEKYMATEFITEEKKRALLRLLSHVFFDRAIEMEYDHLACRATELIDANLSAPLSVDLLCEKLFVSKNCLYKCFHSFFGKTVNEYMTDRRIARAKELLRETGRSALCIAEEVGFENYTYFTKLFKKRTGLTPREFRKLPPQNG